MKNLIELESLSYEEMINVTGGESAWYWIAYGVTNGVRAFVDGVRSGSQEHGHTFYK